MLNYMKISEKYIYNKKTDIMQAFTRQLYFMLITF